MKIIKGIIVSLEHGLHPIGVTFRDDTAATDYKTRVFGMRGNLLAPANNHNFAELVRGAVRKS